MYMHILIINSLLTITRCDDTRAVMKEPRYN